MVGILLLIGAISGSQLRRQHMTSADTGVITVEYKMNLLAPADGQLLIAEDRSSLRADADRDQGRSLRRQDGKKTLCALMRQTIMALHGKKKTNAETVNRQLRHAEIPSLNFAHGENHRHAARERCAVLPTRRRRAPKPSIATT